MDVTDCVRPEEVTVASTPPEEVVETPTSPEEVSSATSVAWMNQEIEADEEEMDKENASDVVHDTLIREITKMVKSVPLNLTLLKASFKKKEKKLKNTIVHLERSIELRGRNFVLLQQEYDTLKKTIEAVRTATVVQVIEKSDKREDSVTENKIKTVGELDNEALERVKRNIARQVTASFMSRKLYTNYTRDADLQPHRWKKSTGRHQKHAHCARKQRFVNYQPTTSVKPPTISRGFGGLLQETTHTSEH
jgi:hypothetical protein